MRNVVFLNRWGHIFHLMLVMTDGETEHRLHSRICMSLEEAQSIIEHWRQKHFIAVNDVQDNSSLDMNELMRGINTDFLPTQN